MALTLHEITSIENLNHPNDYYIYFPGGYLVFNVRSAPLRFWYQGVLVILVHSSDIAVLQEKLRQDEFDWELNYNQLAS